MHPMVVSSLIGAGSTILGGLMSKSGQRDIEMPTDPMMEWMRRAGPGIWSDIAKYGRGQLGKEEGFPPWLKNLFVERGQRPIRAGRETSELRRERDVMKSGLTPLGGQAERRRYYEDIDWAKAMGGVVEDVDIADWMEAKRAETQGLNALLSLSGKAPIYSQINAQNYWNQIQAEMQQMMATGEAIGGFGKGVGDMWMWYQMMEMMKDSPTGPGSTVMYDLFNTPGPTDYTQGWFTGGGTP